MKTIEDILKHLEVKYKLYPHIDGNTRSTNTFCLLQKSKYNFRDSYAKEIIYNPSLQFDLSLFIYNCEQAMTQAHNILFPLILNDDLSFKEEFKPLIQYDSIFDLFKSKKTSTTFNKNLIHFLFLKNLSPVKFLLKCKVFSSIDFQNIRYNIINILSEKSSQIDDNDKINLAKHLSSMRDRKMNKDIAIKIVNIFENNKDCLQILAEGSPSLKQVISNQKGFYFIDEYYNDQRPGIIDINIQSITEMSLRYLESELNQIIKKLVAYATQPYPCEVFFSEKNIRLVSTTKVKKGAEPKLTRNTNIMIQYHHNDQQISYNYCDFFRFTLESLFNEIYEDKENPRETCKKILNSFPTYFEKYLLEFQIPQHDTPDLPTQKF